jgi:hypothetical protein
MDLVIFNFLIFLDQGYGDEIFEQVRQTKVSSFAQWPSSNLDKATSF